MDTHLARRTPKGIGALVLVACTVWAAGVADAASSPTALRAAILQATLAKHSVHYVTVSSGDGAHMRMVSDAGSDRGIQRVTFSKGGRTGHADSLVVGSTAYIRGDAFALHAYMGFPRSFASHYAGRWVSIPPTSPVYAPVAIDVTFPSFASHMIPEAPLSVVRGPAGARNLTGLRGRSSEGPGIATVYVPSNGAALPVKGTAAAAASQPVGTVVTMSRWNEAVRVQAPANAVPLPS